VNVNRNVPDRKIPPVASLKISFEKFQLLRETSRPTIFRSSVEVGCERVATLPRSAVLPQAVGVEIQPRVVWAKGPLELGKYNGRRDVPALSMHIGLCGVKTIEASPD
jgi:hypothetical protein